MSPSPDAFNLSTYCLDPGDAGDPALLVLSDGGATALTRGELRERIERQAGLLANRLAPGQRVALQMRNTPSMAVALLAIMRAGLIAVPLSPQLTQGEIARLVGDAAASLFVTEAPNDSALAGLNVPILQPAALDEPGARGSLSVTAADDPALLIYTSGTGGKPKGVLHAHRVVFGRVPMRADWLGIGPGDRVLHAGSLNWTYTIGVGLLDPLAAGATAVLHAGAAPADSWPQLITNHGITVFAAVPTIYRRMLKYGDVSMLRDGPLRHGVCAGEALSPDLWESWVKMTGRPLYEALGMTEISTYISSGPHTPTRPGSPGRAQTGRRIAILDPEPPHEELPHGEIGLLAIHRSDPGLMLGYWPLDDATDASVFRGDWFVGGDLASLDAEGYVRFHGRADDMLNALGVRLSPLEIEAVLKDHPDVEDAAVTSTRNNEGVELITAFLMTRAELRPDTIKTWAAERLAAYKLPKRWLVVADLPRTANGKLQRRRLANLVGTGAVRNL